MSLLRASPCLLVLGCVVAGDPPVGAIGPIGPDPAVVAGDPLGGRENQGRHLLGALDDLAGATDHLWFADRATRQGRTGVISVQVTGATLTATEGPQSYSGADPRLVGLRFGGSDGSEVEISAAEPATLDAPIRYRLLRRVGAGAWTDPCAGEAAVPLAGRYDLAARHQAPAGDLSFACERGVAYKCTAWGYLAGADTTARAWDLHQACTRMANADYCANGGTNTHEGTYVGMFDADGVRTAFPPTWADWRLTTWLPARGEFFVEASWRPDAPPRCLSKARWASMPLGGLCGDDLPDPRVEPSAAYCEDLSDDELVAGDVLIVNTSMFNDLPLVTWRGPTGDLVSTVRGLYDPPAATQPPFPASTYIGATGVLLRALTAELDPADLVEVRMFCVGATSRCVVTTLATRPASHTVDRGAEGYVFRVQAGDATSPLVLYHHPLTGDHVTSTTAPAGYTAGPVVGWIMPTPS
jgi:hypothetical protein